MKIFKNEKFLKIFSITTLSIALMLGCMGNENVVKAEKTDNLNDTKTERVIEDKKEIPSVLYNTHIQNEGWEEDFSKKDGEMSGTSGKCYRLEAIKIKLDNLKDVSIKYQTHVENIGWQNWKQDGEMSGTQGRSYRLEGIKIKLENTEKYSVMYRVHVQNIGWQDWKYDGEMAGTQGQSLRLEAIEIKIIDKVEKGKMTVETDIPENCYDDTKLIKVTGWKMANVENTKIEATLDSTPITDIVYKERKDVVDSVNGFGTIKENPNPGFEFSIDTTSLTETEHKLKINLVTSEGKILDTCTKNIKVDRKPHVQYQMHVQNIGWQGTRQDGELAGTEGKCLRVEALKINTINLPVGVKLKYQTHVQNIGWQEWKQDGEISGTSGQCLRVEAIRIKLEGTDKYSVKYRMHVQDIGWQDWCYDGETAGTQTLSKRVEAIEIQIVDKIKEEKVQLEIENPSTSIKNEKQSVQGWIMTTIPDVELNILIDGEQLDLSNLKRTYRQDVLNNQKGYGNESIYNKTPGFELEVDFSKYTIGTHKITVQAIRNDKVVKEIQKTFEIKKKIFTQTGTYGYSGLKLIGDWRGSELPYYQYGSGPNVFYATFAIHGFEDLWSYDGKELVEIANNFYQHLVNSEDSNLADKWTIYIFPGVNQDGLKTGWTNNGPGRTSIYSAAPGNQGIDMNRCWQIGNSYTRYTDSRNYNGTTGFQAYEAAYLRNFLINHKSKTGKTVLVDLHGWTQQLIGDSGICSYYRQQFPENDGSAIGRYGTGYLVNWARSTLGARSALIELPSSGVNGHQAVVNKNFSNRYINATLNMLKNI